MSYFDWITCSCQRNFNLHCKPRNVTATLFLKLFSVIGGTALTLIGKTDSGCSPRAVVIDLSQTCVCLV